MAKVSLATIKNWFKTGDSPTQSQFENTWDSFRHKDEAVPISDVNGLETSLEDKADIGHNHNGVYEPVITKKTGFNLPLATQSEEETSTVTNKLSTPSGRGYWWVLKKGIAEQITGIWKFINGLETKTLKIADASTYKTALDSVTTGILRIGTSWTAVRFDKPIANLQGTNTTGIYINTNINGTLQPQSTQLVSGYVSESLLDGNGVALNDNTKWEIIPPFEYETCNRICNAIGAKSFDTIYTYECIAIDTWIRKRPSDSTSSEIVVENGLINEDGIVKIGGLLTESTYIDANSRNFRFDNISDFYIGNAFQVVTEDTIISEPSSYPKSQIRLSGYIGGINLKSSEEEWYVKLKTELLTKDTIIQFPDKNGTVALTSDIPEAINEIFRGETQVTTMFADAECAEYTKFQFDFKKNEPTQIVRLRDFQNGFKIQIGIRNMALNDIEVKFVDTGGSIEYVKYWSLNGISSSGPLILEMGEMYFLEIVNMNEELVINALHLAANA